MIPFIEKPRNLIFVKIKKDYFRFANLLKTLSVDVIRENVRHIKLQKSLDISCQGNYGFNLESGVVDTAEEQLKTNSSDERFNNMTAEDLKTAAEMFIYLNTCPDSWFKSWSSFYRDLFLTKPADQIILTRRRSLA